MVNHSPTSETACPGAAARAEALGQRTGPPPSLVYIYGPNVRLAGALDITKLGRTAWLDLVRAGKAPAPFRIGRATLWRVAEIEAWLEDRVRESRGAGK